MPRVRPAGARTPAPADEGWGPAPASWHPPARVPADEGRDPAPADEGWGPAPADEGWGPAPASWHPPAPVPVRRSPATGPVRVLGDDHPSGPLHLGGAPAGGYRPALPVLAPRPIRRRLAMLLRLVIRPRRGGRHRSDAPHLQAWSMFAPHRNHPRRGRGAA